jgi:hypothetical protein
MGTPVTMSSPAFLLKLGPDFGHKKSAHGLPRAVFWEDFDPENLF